MLYKQIHCRYTKIGLFQVLVVMKQFTLVKKNMYILLFWKNYCDQKLRMSFI